MFYHINFDWESERWNIEIFFLNIPANSIIFQTTPSHEEKKLSF